MAGAARPASFADLGPGHEPALATLAWTTLIPSSGECRHHGPRNALGRYPLPCERHDDTSYH
jgi:hypothetical protein